MKRSSKGRVVHGWLACASIATLFTSSLSLAAEAPEYKIERCCQICPQALQDSSYTGDLGDFTQLVQGQKDWLFRSKIDLMTNIGTTPEGFKLLQDLRDALKARGVELVMVYLPPRGLLVTEMLNPQARSSFNANCRAAITGLPSSACAAWGYACRTSPRCWTCRPTCAANFSSSVITTGRRKALS